MSFLLKIFPFLSFDFVYDDITIQNFTFLYNQIYQSFNFLLLLIVSPHTKDERELEI